MVRMTSNAPEGTPNWLDLGIPDMARAKRFYGHVFGWELQDTGPEGGHYHLCLKDGVPVAGMVTNEEPGADHWWQVYFATDDCDGALKRVADAGGEIVMPADDVGDLGRMAIVKDATGGQFGLWQGGTHVGSGIVNEPGSLVWNELYTPRGEDALAFYRAVFEYGAEPVEELPAFTVLLRSGDGRPMGGLMHDPDQPRSMWRTYFEVEDVDAAVRRVQDEGGRVLEEAVDTPYGRFARVADPFGVTFYVMKSAPEAQG